MTDREQIIELAKQCGARKARGVYEGGFVFCYPSQLEAFFHAAQREALTQAATIIRADKWPTPLDCDQLQVNEGLEALAKRVEQIGGQDGL